MQLIAESGSTKTDWCIINPKSGDKIFKKTNGINPYFSNKNNVLDEIAETFKDTDVSKIRTLFFYGPGCSQPEMKNLLIEYLQQAFPRAIINVETDLLAAGRGVFGNECGIVCILGTGSNSGIYNKGVIQYSLPSLGFIFGDEGSGSFIGKNLIADVLDDNLPIIVKDLFYKTYQVENKDIIAKIYSGSFPNRYLATYTEFVYNNINLAYCRTLVDNAFDSFFIKRLSKYKEINSLPVKFVGSVAFAFADILIKVAQRNGILLNKETNIFKSPLEGLIRFHVNENN